MSLISGNRAADCKYVYELPYTERKHLCNILDINNQWETLGGEELGFTVLELSEIRRAERCGDSPTDRLLHLWGRKNNTVLTLYFHLYNMEHFQAMSVLLPFIPSKYHYEELHKQLPTSLLSSVATQGCATASPVPPTLPKPDPSLLVDLKNKHVIPANSNVNKSKLKLEAAVLNPPLHLVPDHNLCRSPSSQFNKRTGSSSQVEENGAAASVFPFGAGKSVQTQFPSFKDSKPFTKILNTTLPEGARKYPSYSISNENNVEANNSRSPPREQSKPFIKVEIRSGAKDSNQPSEGESSDRGQPVRPTQKDASRKRCQSNCSDISMMSECGVPMIPYEELEEATLSWDPGRLLGSGGFGAVYKGSWKRITVAVKRINVPNQKNGAKLGSSHINQIMDELRFLQKYRLDNILQVYGFSADPEKPHCLVYQFMSNGSLEYRLRCRKMEILSEKAPLPLTWRQRFEIARGTATALQFLHTLQETPLIHGDVKSANILLDDNLEPKLGDFGLAREGPQSGFTSMQVSHVHGTLPYIPEEYLRSNKLSTKVDTYSFGVVLFEICSGRMAYDDKTRKYLKDEVSVKGVDRYIFMDKKVGVEGMAVYVFNVLFDIGMECINRNPKNRPDMTTVHENLSRLQTILKGEDRQRRYQFEDSLLMNTPYSPSPAHQPFPAFLLPRPVLSHAVPPLSPPWLQAATLSPPPIPPPQPSFPPRLTLPPPFRGDDNRTSIPVHTPIPAFSELLNCSAEDAQRSSEWIPQTDSESLSTEELSDEIKMQMNSVQEGPGALAKNQTDTVMNVCIPLLSELGIHQGDKGSHENQEKHLVSAQGKKSFLD